MSGPFGPWFEDRPKEGWDGVTVHVSEGRIPQVIEAIERIESRRDIQSHLRIVHALRGEELVVSVVAGDLARFYSRVIIPLGTIVPGSMPHMITAQVKFESNSPSSRNHNDRQSTETYNCEDR